MPIYQSKIPIAIDALVAIFGSADGLQGLAIRDGASVDQSRVMEVLSVGYTGMEGEADAEALSVTEGLGGSPDRERFTIRCVVVVATGGTNMPAARRRVYELFGAAAAAIAANRTLDGAVMRAMVGSQSLTQYQTDQGAQAAVAFGVECDAFTR